MTRWLERSVLLVVLAGLLMAPQTAQVNTYVNGQVLTADQLNAEFGNLYSTINGLDEDNFLSSTSFSPANISATIDGNGITRNVTTGALSFNPDGVTLEINADLARIKDLGVSTAKLANDAVTAAKILDGTVTGTDVSGTTTLAIGNGAVGTPAYRFTSDPDTGIYSSGGDKLAIAAGGTQVAELAPQGLLTRGGAVGMPSLSFLGDPDTGLYSFAANRIGVSVGGTNVATVTSFGVETSASTGVAAGGNEFIKWKVVSLPTTASVAVGAVGASSGLHGVVGTILGVIASGEISGTSGVRVSNGFSNLTGAASTAGLQVIHNASTVTLYFTNTDSASKSYTNVKALVYYQ